MLTWEEDVEAAALRAQGWSIAAIARHLGRDPKTIRAYLDGNRTPGQRQRSTPNVFAPFVDYVAARLAEDRHVWATALYDEVQALGYPGSYPSFTRALRSRGLRPRCEACAGVKGRETVDIAHPPGQEQQWDWADLPGAPWGGVAHVLVGALSYSSQARAVLAEAQDLPHLVEALDSASRSSCWRTSRSPSSSPSCSARACSFWPFRHRSRRSVSFAPARPRPDPRRRTVRDRDVPGCPEPQGLSQQPSTGEKAPADASAPTPRARAATALCAPGPSRFRPPGSLR
jgi:Helix-turn-helix domain